MVNLSEIYRKTRQIFRDHNIENADLDARLLVEFFTKTTRTDEILNPARPVSANELKRIEKAVQKRLGHVPVYRIIGKREFFGIEFSLSEDTLEPRDDTGTLVDMVLPVINLVVHQKKTAKILDMGTGTGAVAVALLANTENTEATAVDISEDALATATTNAQNAEVGARFTPCLSNWFDMVYGQFDVIISNPPYIPHADISSLAREVREHDPLRALDGGEDGLDFYRKLASQSAKFLKTDGIVAVEIGQGQEDDVSTLFRQNGFHRIEARKDLSGIMRALMFSL